MLPILTVNFIGSLGFSIVLPFLVFLVQRWGGNALIYGVVGSTYSAFQLIGAPLLGRWSDVYGRRKILLLSQFGTLASWLIFLSAFFLSDRPLLQVDSATFGAFAVTLPLLVLFVARAADGATGGNISVANAYMADITTEDERSANFGKMAASSNLGFIVGPAAAGLLAGSAGGEIAPVLAALAVSAIACLLIFRLPESRPCRIRIDPLPGGVRKTFGQEHKECFRRQPSRRISFREILGLGCVPALLAIYFLVMLAFSFFYVSFPAHAAGALGWSVSQTGVFFSVMSLAMVLVQGPVLARVSKRVSGPFLIVGGSLVLAAGFAFYDSVEVWSMYTGLALMALGNGLMWPSVLAVLSKASGAEHQGAVQGIAGSVGAVASIVGLVAGGLIYGHFGGRVFWIPAATTLGVCLLAAVLLPSTRRAVRRAASPK